MSNEKVSIIMPCYNDGEFIEESIQSAINQSYENTELIIIDDGSTDKKTKDIFIKNKWPKTKIIRSNHIGVSAARNLGINISEGMYILPLDADDLIERNYIEKCVKVLNSDNKIGIVYCKAKFFGKRSGYWDIPKYNLEKMLVENLIFNTAMYRKTDWELTGGYDIKMKAGMEDYDFWLSLIEIGKDVFQIPEVLFHYRIKNNSRNTKFQSDIDSIIRTYEAVYDNHSVLFNKNKEVYIKILREEMYKLRYKNIVLEQSIEKLNFIRDIQFVKRFINKYVFKK